VLKIDVERLVRETTVHSPLEGKLPFPFLGVGYLTASFSKDLLPFKGEVGTFCHLSINHPIGNEINVEEVLAQFKEVLGEPTLLFNAYPAWVIKGGKSTVTQHFFWRTEDEQVPLKDRVN